MKNSIFTTQEAVDKVVRCGKIYRDKLADKSFLVLYKDRILNSIEYLELIFRPSNYQHMTGLQLVDDEGNEKKHCSIEFYHKCISSLLIPDEIRFKDNTTNLKLNCLDNMMSFTRISKITGEYKKESKIFLDGDYLIGGINGFYTISRNEDNCTYYPRSIINDDIRKYAITSNQILAIFSTKYNKRNNYPTVCYVAHGVNLTNLSLADAVKNKIKIP